MRKLLVALVVLPLAAFAQGPGGGQGTGPGAPPERGAGPRQGRGDQQGDAERMQRRMRLARTLGLAEAVGLDEAQALKLGDVMAKFDDRRVTAHRQIRDSYETLRRAASSNKAAPADVDQAIQRGLDARAQLQALDRETVAAVTKDLTPDQKARAVLFLARFQHRFGHGPGHGEKMRGMGHGEHGRMGAGPGGGMGMGPGSMMGMGSGCGADCSMDGDVDDEG
jgi:hypothetical protein